MGLLNSVAKIAGKIDLKDVMSKIDDSKLTQAEKSELQVNFYKQTLGENSARSYTRRWLTFIIVINIFALMWFCIFKEDSTKILDTAERILRLPAFYMVLVFFYGGYYGDKIFNKKEKK